MDYPSTFQSLFTAYLVPVSPGPTTQLCIDISNNPEARSANFFEVLNRDPLYLHMLLKLPLLDKKVAAWGDDEKGSPRANHIISKRILQLLGKSASRNVLLSIYLRRKTPGGLPRGKKEQFNLNSQDDVKFAIQAESICSEDNLAYGTEAFLAGLHYDWLRLSLTANKAPKEAIGSLSEDFKQGILAAKHAYHIAGLMKEFKFTRAVFGCALLTHVGTSLMHLLYPKELQDQSFSTFTNSIEKRFKNNRIQMRAMLEPRWFQVTTVEVSSLLASCFGPFAGTEKAIRYAHTPVFLKGSDPDLLKLACILSIANHLTELQGDTFRLPHYQSHCASILRLTSSKIEKAWRDSKKKKEVSA